MMARRAALAAILTALTAAFTTPIPRRTPVIALRAQKSTALELATLKKGDKLLGRLASPVFEGARGVKCFVDVRAVRTLDGDARPVNGLLRMPKWRRWNNATDAYKTLGSNLRKAKSSGEPLACYVVAARPASAQLVLSPFPPKPKPPRLALADLEIGDELRPARIADLTKRAAWLEVPVVHGLGRPGRRGARLRACLRGSRLPPGVALASAPVKAAGTTRVLRAGDVLDRVYVRKPEPQSGRLEVGLEPVDAAVLAAERARAAATRRKRGDRKALAKRLAVGMTFRGAVVVRRERYGAVVDFGASAFGLVPRGDRDVDFAAVGDAVDVSVVAVEAREGKPLAPRVTLELLEAEAVEEVAAIAVPAAPRNAAPEPEDDEDDYRDVDDIDDIEESLGLDMY